MEIQLEREPLVLAITTSGKSGGLALYKERPLWEINFLARESYAKGLLEALSYLFHKVGLKPEDLDFLAVDLGPGSFTGLRIGLSVIKALTLIREVPVLPLTSLELLAWQYPLVPYPILTIIDAYSRELYVAKFSWHERHLLTLLPPTLLPWEGLKDLVSGPTLFVSETLEKWEDEFREAFGNGFLKPPFPPRLTSSLLSQVVLLKLRRGELKPLKGEEVLPLYLKASEAERKKCFTIS